MKNYYLLSWEDRTELASAFPLQEAKLNHELIPELDGKNTLPFDFELKRVKESKNGLIIDDNLAAMTETWLDYQPNERGWPLMSEPLKSLIESNLTGKEHIDWITCKVRGGNEERVYFILRFNELLDVLDMQRTSFVQGTDHIIKPVFALSKICQYSIFPKPLAYQLWKIPAGFYVNDTVRKEIRKKKLTGLDFEKVSVS